MKCINERRFKMKRIFFIALIALLSMSLVFAIQVQAPGVNVQANEDGSNADINVQGEDGSDIQVTTSGGAGEKVQSGVMVSSKGEQIQVQTQTEEGTKLRVNNVEAHSSMEMTQKQDLSGTSLHVALSNGKNSEVKVMPNTASERAIERLQIKSCTAEENCSIELKEVGTGEEIKAAYEVKAKKEAKFLGLFSTELDVEAQVDAETGEVIKAKKSWWAFLATE
jgi:hypothetical protein